MGRFFGYENIPPVTKASGTSLTLATTYLGQPTIVKVGGQAYTPSSTVTLNTGTTGINGIDTGTFTANTLYYVYAVVSGGVLGLIISTTAPSTGPTGFTSAYKYLAKFRTLVGSAAIADVNSIWVGASQDQSGAAIGEWTSFTPTWNTFSGSLNAGSYGRWRRVGSVMEIQTSARISAFTSMGALTLTAPTSLTVDSNFDGDQTVNNLGSATFYDDTANVLYTGKVAHDTTDRTKLVLYSATGAAGNAVSSSFPFPWANNDRWSVHAQVPIAEWAGVFTTD